MTAPGTEFLTICLGIFMLGVTLAILIRAIAPQGFIKGKK